MIDVHEYALLLKERTTLEKFFIALHESQTDKVSAKCKLIDHLAHGYIYLQYVFRSLIHSGLTDPDRDHLCRHKVSNKRDGQTDSVNEY